MKKILLTIACLALAWGVQAQTPSKFHVTMKDKTVHTFEIADIDSLWFEAEEKPIVVPDILTDKTYHIDVPALDDPMADTDPCVIKVMAGSSQVAELCYEYIRTGDVDKRMMVFYPIGEDGKADLTRGFTANDGGSLVWNLDANTCTYTPGSLNMPYEIFLENGKFVAATTQTDIIATTQEDYVLTDVRGNSEEKYDIVKIGTQYWMAQNLRADRLNDGTPITKYAAQQGAQWNAATTPCYHVFTDDADILADWGAMYNGYAAISDKLAPEGWAVTTIADWQKMKDYLATGQSRKVKSQYEWNDTPGNGNNLSGLNVKPGGFFVYTSQTDDESQWARATYWTPDKYTDTQFGGSTLAVVIIYNSVALSNSNDGGKPYNHSYQYGHYIRCIRK